MVESALKAMLADRMPAQDDRLFTLRVMARIEQRRFHRAVMLHVAAAALGVLVLALVMPQLDFALQAGFDPLVSRIGIALALLVAGVGVPRLLKA